MQRRRRQLVDRLTGPVGYSCGKKADVGSKCSQGLVDLRPTCCRRGGTSFNPSIRPDPSTESVTLNLSVPKSAITTRPVGSVVSTSTTCAPEEAGISARTALSSAALILSRNKASKWASISCCDKGTSATELKIHASCVSAGPCGTVTDVRSAALVDDLPTAEGDPDPIPPPQEDRTRVASTAPYAAARRSRFRPTIQLSSPNGTLACYRVSDRCYARFRQCTGTLSSRSSGRRASAIGSHAPGRDQ